MIADFINILALLQKTEKSHSDLEGACLLLSPTTLAPGAELRVEEQVTVKRVTEIPEERTLF